MRVKGRTCLLAGTPNRLIIIIQDNTHLIHQSHLLLVVSLEFCAPSRRTRRGGVDFAGQRGVDLGEERVDIVRRDAGDRFGGHGLLSWCQGGLTVLIRGCWFKPGKIIREILRGGGIGVYRPRGGGVGQNKYMAGLWSSNK